MAKFRCRPQIFHPRLHRRFVIFECLGFTVPSSPKVEIKTLRSSDKFLKPQTRVHARNRMKRVCALEASRGYRGVSTTRNISPLFLYKVDLTPVRCALGAFHPSFVASVLGCTHIRQYFTTLPAASSPLSFEFRLPSPRTDSRQKRRKFETMFHLRGVWNREWIERVKKPRRRQLDNALHGLRITFNDHDENDGQHR